MMDQSTAHNGRTFRSFVLWQHAVDSLPQDLKALHHTWRARGQGVDVRRRWLPE
jgi:hypothetical protein